MQYYKTKNKVTNHDLQEYFENYIEEEQKNAQKNKNNM